MLYTTSLIRRFFKDWYAKHCDTLGTASTVLLALGVCSLFMAAGLLLHERLRLIFTHDVVSTRAPART